MNSRVPLVLLVFCSITTTIGDPSLHYDTIQLLQAAGFTPQKFEVLTADGYHCSLFRMDSKATRSRPPVLLMHGMTLSSDSWLLQEPKSDLAYMLYDAGYDVWLGDFRGNYYSKQLSLAESLNPKYWEFSFHEHGVEDLPALINTIIKITRVRKIGYVGYSMGTTSFFIMASQKPEMVRKISLFVALSPVATMNYKNYPVVKKALVEAGHLLLTSAAQIGVREILPRSWLAQQLTSAICAQGSGTENLCYAVVSLWFGSEKNGVSRETLPRVLAHAPAGISIYTALHYIQMMLSGEFEARDLGFVQNKLRYNSTEPPEYAISRTSCPVAAHYSDADLIVNSTELKANMKELPQLVDLIQHKGYNHLDFIWGKNAKTQVYPLVLRNMKKYHRI